MPSEKEILDQIEELSKEVAIRNLLKEGIDANYTQVIIDKLKYGVINGSNVTDILGELNTLIAGSENKLGLLERYVKQVQHDALAQFQGTYTEAIAQSAGIEWYYYIGTLIRDSRPFCVEFVDKYFHKKEVEMLGEGINPFTGAALEGDLLQGRMSGTNASNIFTNRGGWRCRHFFSPTVIQGVPKKDVERALNKGYITLSNKQKERLGII